MTPDTFEYQMNKFLSFNIKKCKKCKETNLYIDDISYKFNIWLFENNILINSNIKKCDNYLKNKYDNLYNYHILKGYKWECDMSVTFFDISNMFVSS